MKFYCEKHHVMNDTKKPFNPKYNCGCPKPCEPRQCKKCGNWKFLQPGSNLEPCKCSSINHQIATEEGLKRFKGLKTQERITKHLYQIAHHICVYSGQRRSIIRLCLNHYSDLHHKIYCTKTVRSIIKCEHPRLIQQLKDSKLKIKILK